MKPTYIFLLIIFYFTGFILSAKGLSSSSFQTTDTLKIDRAYELEATMLGYFNEEGTRNPVLQANKGDLVKITIKNGENMTHDIALEKLGIKSDVVIEKGASTSITFKADENDTYFCTIPGHRAAGMVGKFEVVKGQINKDLAVTGILPVKDNKEINLNFESGTLQDWTEKGEAFSKYIISEDPSPVHEKEMKINHDGKYFITSGGSKNYKLVGALYSVPFKVTHPYASFKISGGALEDTRVELVNAVKDSIFFQVSGSGRATLQPVVVDLNQQMGQEIYIRIIDNETGISQIPYIEDDKWAHINFDDFKFHPQRPQYDNELKREDIIVLPPLDHIPHAGLSGEEAARSMTLQEGFNVTLAASEPDVIRPICFTIDSRGRLWVVEAHTYPIRAAEGEGKDRILIFEDTNGDGKLNKRTVFMEGLNLVSGIEVGMGGVWLGAAPYLLFIPIDNKDKPSGPPQVVLDGFGFDDTHETLNSLNWGPDGWLYGAHGVFTHSNVGKPGSLEEQRTKLNAGVWRYHPKKQKFEVFAEGTSNPWGVDFNEYGHTFATVCVIPHMFHIIQGARYQRQAGEHFNPYIYEDIKTIADHVHWVGDRGPHAGNFRSGSKGGGHAHAGAMIYQGGDSWPEKYRNNIFMNNINGSRVNVDQLVRNGSGYKALHNDDFLLTNDTWSQWLNFRYTPGGSVFVIDWYDKNQCHSPNPDVHNKTMGRIFKISHVKDQWLQVDLSKASDLELVNFQLHQNDWYVRQARLLLQKREPNKKVQAALKKILNENPDATRKLRALWALHVTEGLKEKDLLNLLSHENEYLRSWAVQLLLEDKKPSEAALKHFRELAKNDKSALVRLYLASGLQRIDPEKRWEILEGLVQRVEDKDDHNLPLMLWYATEPLVKLDVKRARDLAMKSASPYILPFTIKRLGAIGSTESKTILEDLNQQLLTMDPHQFHEAKSMINKILNENK